MTGTEHFKQAIKAYLDERAKTDRLFAVSYAKKTRIWTIASRSFSPKQKPLPKRAVAV